MKMKKPFIFPIFVLFCFFSCNMKNESIFPETSNKEASSEAKELLSFLYSIQGKYTLSGQHNFISTGEQYTDEVYKITGKYPVVWGSDFSFQVKGDSAVNFHHCGPMNLKDPALTLRDKKPLEFINLSVDELRQNLVNEVIRQHKKGHIITLMWHGCFPTEGDLCDGSSIWAMQNRPDEKTWQELTSKGTELNASWKKQVDNIAHHLQKLQEAKIPVLWRPYHEMNGVWFWWCNQKGENGFKKLWIMLYDYFTKDKKLNNLIWVWNTNAPRNIPGDEAFPYSDFFPGSEYVDILAADVYANDYKQSHHDDLRKIANGKLIALGEIGTVPSAEILKSQNQWSWFMTWGYFVNLYNDSEAIKKLYNAPNVLSLEDIKKMRK